MSEKYCVYDESVGKEIVRLGSAYYDDIARVMREYPGVSWRAMLLTLGHQVATIATNAALGHPLDRKDSDSPIAETKLAPPEARASEVRLNPDKSLDEVVGHGYGHLEQMDFNHWWLQVGDVAVWLHAKGAIRATYERRQDSPLPQPREDQK